MGCWGRAAAGCGGPAPGRPARGKVHAPAVRSVVRRRLCVPAGASVPAAQRTERRPATEPAGPRNRRRWPWRTGLAILGGLALLLAFPGFDRPALAPLGPAALALAVRGQRARSGAWLGLVLGLSFFVPLLSWTGVYVGSLPWLALAGWEALHLALLGAATAVTGRLRWWPLWTAALWVADEALRGRLVLGGFPWGRLGLSQTRGPLLSLAAYGGGAPGRLPRPPARPPL